MAEERKRLTWKYYYCFLLWTCALGGYGYYLLWDEINYIRDLIPENNRDRKESCYSNPLLSVQIWTRDSHFHPFYTMQDVVYYFNCLDTDEALDAIRMFYVTYNIGGLVLIMGFIVFLLVISRYSLWYAIEVAAFPTIFGIAEGVFIFVLAGNFKKSNVGGLSEMHCQLCSSLGLIFWVLFVFVLVICIYGLTMECRRCCRDRQNGIKIKTLRDRDSSSIFLSDRGRGSDGTKKVKTDVF